MPKQDSERGMAKKGVMQTRAVKLGLGRCLWDIMTPMKKPSENHKSLKH